MKDYAQQDEKTDFGRVPNFVHVRENVKVLILGQCSLNPEVNDPYGNRAVPCRTVLVQIGQET